jgi:hypothetical protein
VLLLTSCVFCFFTSLFDVSLSGIPTYRAWPMCILAISLLIFLMQILVLYHMLQLHFILYIFMSFCALSVLLFTPPLLSFSVFYFDLLFYPPFRHSSSFSLFPIMSCSAIRIPSLLLTPRTHCDFPLFCLVAGLIIVMLLF